MKMFHFNKHFFLGMYVSATKIYPSIPVAPSLDIKERFLDMIWEVSVFQIVQTKK